MTFQETGRGKVRRKKQTFDVTSYFQTADRRSAVEAAAPAKRTERKRKKKGVGGRSGPEGNTAGCPGANPAIRRFPEPFPLGARLSTHAIVGRELSPSRCSRYVFFIVPHLQTAYESCVFASAGSANAPQISDGTSGSSLHPETLTFLRLRAAYMAPLSETFPEHPYLRSTLLTLYCASLLLFS